MLLLNGVDFFLLAGKQIMGILLVQCELMRRMRLLRNFKPH